MRQIEEPIVINGRAGWALRSYINDQKIELSKESESIRLQIPENRRDESFFLEEFEQLKTLPFKSDLLPYLEFFKNVNRIEVNLDKEIDNEMLGTALEKFPNLKELEVRGCPKIEYIDIRNIPNLKSLELVADRGLMGIKGLEESKLKNLKFIDNISYQPKYDSLIEYVGNLLDKGGKATVDINYVKDLKEYAASNDKNIEFGETFSVIQRNEENIISKAEALDILDKAENTVNQYTKESDNILQKYAVLYEYLCQHVDYGFKEAQAVNSFKDDKFHEEYKIHSVTGAFENNLSVCEGYNKSLQFMLNLCDIQSETLSVVGKDKSFGAIANSRLFGGNHKILIAEVEGHQFYSDITDDASFLKMGYTQNNLFFTKDEISEKYKFKENIESPAILSLTEKEKESLKEFAINRIHEVDSKDKEHEQYTVKSYDEMCHVFRDPDSYKDELHDYCEKHFGSLDVLNQEQLYDSIKNRVEHLNTYFDINLMSDEHVIKQGFHSYLCDEVSKGLEQFHKHYGNIDKDNFEQREGEASILLEQIKDDIYKNRDEKLEYGNNIDKTIETLSNFYSETINKEIEINKEQSQKER